MKKNVSFPEGHLVIVVAIINDDDGTIAQARRIARNKETNRATIGFLEINLKEMV